MKILRTTVLAAALLLFLRGAVQAAVPEICRIQGGNTKTIWGVGFDEKAQVWGWETPFDLEKVLAAIGGKTYDPVALLPATPPQGSRQLKVLSREERGLVMAVEFDSAFHAGGFTDARAGWSQAVWVKNDDGFSRPRLVRSAAPWWVYPEKTVAGGRVRVFGRNLMRNSNLVNLKETLVVLRPKNGGASVRVRTFGDVRHEMYEIDMTLPKDLAPGEYDIYVHNGAGGTAGWGGPVGLEVIKTVEIKKAVFNAMDYGARGNGIEDDTQALRKALVTAGEAGGGIVFLPPGRYAISATLWVPTGVTLQGAGTGASEICVLESRPMHWDVPADIARAMPGHFLGRQRDADLGAMIWLRDGGAVTDLSLTDGPGTLQAVFGSHDNCRAERLRIRASNSATYAVMVEWGSYGFVLRDCDIVGIGAVFMVHGPHTHLYIGNNILRSAHPGRYNTLFVRAPERSVIENNLVSDGDRNFSSQTGFAPSSFHTILMGNVLNNGVPRRHNSGETMYESASSAWRGYALRADRESVTVDAASIADKKLLAGMVLLVLDGRGLGQYRRIASIDGGIVKVTPAWDVVPDSRTYLTAGRFTAEHLWIDNTENTTAGWSGFWGGNLGHVVDGHVVNNGEGLYIWGYNDKEPAPVAFVDIIGSRTSNRGNFLIRGNMVFGNTIRFCEALGFRYRSGQHIQPEWLRGLDTSEKSGVSLEPNWAHDAAMGRKPQPMGIEGLPATAPLRDWNIVEGTHIYDGPRGIYAGPGSRHNIFRSNTITVDGAPVTDEGEGNLFLNNKVAGK